ncbi:hypothetical protein HYU14_07460, partial [Candidatus Woesearchaeota archaeon]|nr:hypothetical protein [Candidatus Woesearchaeota archaeon]
MVSQHPKRVLPLKIPPSIILLILLVILVYSSLSRFGFTGYLILRNEVDYANNVSIDTSRNFSYTLNLNQSATIKSLRLDGAASKRGMAKVFLEYGGKSYLVFDSRNIGKESLPEPTESPPSGAPGANASDGGLTLNLRGGGRKDFGEIFAFMAEGKFDWGVDYSKLCTRWDINGNALCYGAEECCSLIDLSPIGGWNDTLYLSYGRYDSGLNNSIKAQIIYANFSLESGNPYSDVRYSEVKTAEAEFYEETIPFTDACMDTCLLPGFNVSSLKLVFEVEDANISLSNIRYSSIGEKEISKNSPSLAKDIDDILVFKNESVAINLSGIFEDKDGDALNYSAESVENLSIIMGDSGMVIIPDINFTGRRSFFVSASDGYYTAYSNTIAVDVIEKPLGQAEVNVSETTVKPKVVINRPVRWVKIVNASSDVANLTVNISSDALNVTVRDISRSEGSEDIMGVGESSIGGHMEL